MAEPEDLEEDLFADLYVPSSIIDSFYLSNSYFLLGMTLMSRQIAQLPQ